MQKKKYFTPESANMILPEVRNIVEKIILKQTEIDSIRDNLEAPTTSGSKVFDQVTMRIRLEMLYSELAELVVNLQEKGCLLKDIYEGLVDFPALRLGEEVYLCWKIGEQSVDHWHGVYEGFMYRKRVVSDEFIVPTDMDAEDATSEKTSSG
ncbi:MAG: DUF2203 domain-containing protein [Thermoprotei archaeon]